MQNHRSLYARRVSDRWVERFYTADNLPRIEARNDRLRRLSQSYLLWGSPSAKYSIGNTRARAISTTQRADVWSALDIRVTPPPPLPPPRLVDLNYRGHSARLCIPRWRLTTDRCRC